MENIESYSVNTPDGPLQEVLDGFRSEIAELKKADNDLLEEDDIRKSENAELALNQRYLGELLGNLILAMTEQGRGVEIKDGNVHIYPPPNYELMWEESDLFVSMTKFKTGRETLMELLGGKHEAENWPQFREVLKNQKGEES